jgi:hypothetical protein
VRDAFLAYVEHGGDRYVHFEDGCCFTKYDPPFKGIYAMFRFGRKCALKPFIEKDFRENGTRRTAT